MRVCLMIEGQEGVTWDQWVALARTAEDGGFEALFRSDHYAALGGEPGFGSLDAWSTINALATVTTRLRLGTLVSPVTFRHPSTLAREVVTADHVSGGRVELGLGAGWNEREHAAHGFPFDSARERFDRLEEQLEIVRRSWDAEPFEFDGDHYRLERADPRPKPVQQHPPVIIGGVANPRSVALAKRWADEYNTLFATPEECRERAERVKPLPLSLMTTFLIGTDEAAVRARAERLGQEPQPTWVAGTPDQVVARLRELEAAGVQRVMLQHLLHDDLEAVELTGREVIPAVS